ncbi:MAG: D-inositol-3-phosphate glycosyltransferase [Chlamydiia bacterium]|nr:D-inositol-3-phosphate glycosyltransferase [Chlamydiia bacterium]MCH9615718.1 D-inositol-3-phosphate glycosyltransferase [Chlamydiia bacterium]MCH9628879.1 D-inositol-3-phosphate glycosyltransferase [Chlamydiia bacterium]
MRILLTNTGSYGTGSFTASKALMNEFIKLGHEVLLTICEANPTEELQEHFGIWKFPLSNEKASIKNFPLIIPDPNPRNKEGRTLSDLNEAEFDLYFSSLKAFLTNTIQTFKPDIVECQHIWAHSVAMNELDLPFLAAAHNSDQMGFEQDTRMQPLIKKAATNALKLFSCSNELKAHMIELYQIEPSHIEVIHNGYDTNIFSPKYIDREKVLMELNLNIPKNAYLIAFGGKVSKTKGIDILIKANEHLPKEENIHFIIIGSGDPHTVLDEPLENYQTENIHFIGHQAPETLVKIFNIADLGTLPSRREGFSIAALEAFGCGLPLVATPPGMPEGHEVGQIVPIEDPKALASAYLSMKNLPQDKRKNLTQKALDVAANFSWTAIAKQRLSVYKNVLGKS